LGQQSHGWPPAREAVNAKAAARLTLRKIAGPRADRRLVIIAAFHPCVAIEFQRKTPLYGSAIHIGANTPSRRSGAFGITGMS
jgi:hypothetical protein